MLASTGSSPKAALVHADRFLGDLEHADAFDAGWRCRVKYLSTSVAVQADGLEQLRAAVATCRSTRPSWT